MVGKDWKLTAAESDVLATDKPFMDKVSEIVGLTDDELALVSGGGGGDGWDYDDGGCDDGGGDGWGCDDGYRHRRHRRHHHHRRHHRDDWW